MGLESIDIGGSLKLRNLECRKESSMIMKFILFANENKRKKGKKNTKIQKVKIVSLLKDRNDYVCLRVSETTLYFFFFYFFFLF